MYDEPSTSKTLEKVLWSTTLNQVTFYPLEAYGCLGCYWYYRSREVKPQETFCEEDDFQPEPQRSF